MTRTRGGGTVCAQFSFLIWLKSKRSLHLHCDSRHAYWVTLSRWLRKQGHQSVLISWKPDSRSEIPVLFSALQVPGLPSFPPLWPRRAIMGRLSRHYQQLQPRAVHWASNQAPPLTQSLTSHKLLAFLSLHFLICISALLDYCDKNKILLNKQ